MKIDVVLRNLVLILAAVSILWLDARLDALERRVAALEQRWATPCVLAAPEPAPAAPVARTGVVR